MTQMMFHVLLLGISVLCAVVAQSGYKDPEGISGETYVMSLFFFIPLEVIYWIGYIFSN